MKRGRLVRPLFVIRRVYLLLKPMVSELILVNISSSPTTVNLPTGRPIIVLPGFGIAGDYFSKYMQAGILMPVAAIPANFKIRGIAEPLRSEGVRTSRDPSSAAVAGNPRGASGSDFRGPAVPSAISALAKEGSGTSNQDVASSFGINTPTSELLDGVTREGWVSRVQSISDTTLAQQMKLDQLRGLARFLGIDSADLLSTKAEIISAVRIRCRG